MGFGLAGLIAILAEEFRLNFCSSTIDRFSTGPAEKAPFFFSFFFLFFLLFLPEQVSAHGFLDLHNSTGHPPPLFFSLPPPHNPPRVPIIHKPANYPSAKDPVLSNGLSVKSGADHAIDPNT